MAYLSRNESSDPTALFQKWFEEAGADGHPMPEAMSLSTVDADNHPSARMVLLKGVDERGFVFFTNYKSRKAEDLAQNPNAALVFWWENIRKQVRVRGEIAKTTTDESDHYFATRARDSQLGAWASEQSRTLPDRAFLENRFREFSLKYEGQTIPRPAHWGGYRLEPKAIEFWREGAHRLHDRILFEREESGGWSSRRLSP